MTRGRIVLAPDKFKGSLDALGVARAIERGLRRGGETREIVAVPMADGGEGTVDAFLATGARAVSATVSGPFGAPVVATFARTEATAIIEMASASGLALLHASERDALRATTFGTGELVRAALDDGARHVVLAIGGSASNDGGAGLLAALGARLRDPSGTALAPGGAALAELETIDLAELDPRLRDVTFEVAADVDNPLCGPHGASAVFGPQKGASPADVALLDRALGRFADLSAATLGRDHRDEPGSGAAGGLGFGARAFLAARIRPGVEIVAALRGLGAALDGAALCITGEGRIDVQTARGKTVAGVAGLAQARGVPVIALAGTLDHGVEDELTGRGITCLPILDRPLALAEAVEEAGPLIERAATRLARLIAALDA